MEQKNLGNTSIGMQANVAATLSYALGMVTGIIFYLVEKDNKFVRFHAMQSIVVFGSLFVINIAITFMLGMVLPWGVRSMISGLIGIVSLILWIVLMMKAYQGERFKLPIAGDIAEKNS
jgi:uncharacterized membrane protein